MVFEIELRVIIVNTTSNGNNTLNSTGTFRERVDSEYKYLSPFHSVYNNFGNSVYIYAYIV